VSAIQKAMEYDGPFLIDFVVEPEENIYPMVAPGCTLAEIIEAPKHKVKVQTGLQETSNL